MAYSPTIWTRTVLSRAGTWHTVLLNPDEVVFLVENNEITEENSETSGVDDQKRK
jgi:hypothetical protein